MFAIAKTPAHPIIMLGDSITEFADWPELTGCATVVNRGISSDTSAGVLSRIDEVTALKPAAVFLLIGVSDIAAKVHPKTVAHNIRRISDILIETKLYIHYVFPVSKERDLTKNIDTLNRFLSSIPVQKIDLRPMLASGPFINQEMTVDGIHLSANGYKAWRDAISPMLNTYCG